MNKSVLYLIIGFVLGVSVVGLLFMYSVQRSVPDQIDRPQKGPSPVGNSGSVKVVGVVMSQRMCTAMACVGESQCCNSCGGSLFIQDNTTKEKYLLEKSSGVAYQCKGNECSMTCDEAIVEGKGYEVTGTVRMGGETNPEVSKVITVSSIKAR